MFCPGCGLEDTNSAQYCRSCGTDLQSVSGVLTISKAKSDSSASTRIRLEQAIAAKIQTIETSSDFKKILPEVKKMLESPEERMLRRIRTGSIVSFVGLGAAVGFLLASIFGPDKDVIIMSAMGFVTLCIGLAMITNGIFFTVPASSAGEIESSGDFKPPPGIGTPTNDLLMPPAARREFASVTENTTRHLGEKDPIARSTGFKENLD